MALLSEKVTSGQREVRSRRDICGWVATIRAPEVRRAGSPGSEFVTTNRLAESDDPPVIDYDALLEKTSGDFGIRSDIVEAAGQEPEYHGADTLVVPLYIPEGAVPINLARIARSETSDHRVELVKLEVPHSESLLIRRIGPITGRRPPALRSVTYRPRQRPRTGQLPPIRRSDLEGFRPAVSTTPKSPSNFNGAPPPLIGFGMRLSLTNSGRLGTVQDQSSQQTESHSDDEFEDNIRAKKNELSKNSQFHDLRTTESNSSEASTLKTTTSTSSITTAEKPRSTIKFLKRPITTTSTPSSASSSTQSVTTTSESTTKSSLSVSITTDSTPTTSTLKPASPITTTTSTSPKPSLSTEKTPAKISSTTTLSPLNVVSTTKLPVTSTTVWDRRSILFPKPVESILKVNTAETTTTTPTTTTEKSSTTRNPVAPLRSLPLWLTRTNTSLTTVKPNIASSQNKTRITEISERPRTDRGQLNSSSKSTTESNTSQRLSSTTTESPKTTRRSSLRLGASSEKQLTTTSSTTDSTTSPFKSMANDEILKDKSTGNTENASKAEDVLNITETRVSTETPGVTNENAVVIDSNRDSTSTREEDKEWNLPLFRVTTEKSNQAESSTEKIESAIRLSDVIRETEILSLKVDESGRKVISRVSDVAKEDSEVLPVSEEESKPLGTSQRKIFRRPRPNSENKETSGRIRELAIHERLRRPDWRRTAPPPITQLSDFFKIPKETVAISTVRRDETTTQRASKTTITVSATTSPTPTTTTVKSPEEIVIESLTEIMRDATSNNKSKDKVSNIASNLEALNQRLAERGIHIIHAEVDGVRIILDNRTLPRPTTPPTPTTFHPPAGFTVTFTPTISTTTEKYSTRSVFPVSETHESLLFPIAKTEEELEKDISTSIRTSLSVHTLKPTDLENETDSENEVQGTTNDSSFTTFKPTVIRKLTTKLRGESQSPVLTASILPSSEDAIDDIPSANNTKQEENPETPIVGDTFLPIRTSSPAGVGEKEEERSSSSVAIFATSTVPPSVTTRTRSTTVPITTRIVAAEGNTPNHDKSFFDEPIADSEEQPEITSVHPTSHHRPAVISKPEDEHSLSDVSFNSSATRESGFDTFSYATIQEDTPPTPLDKKSKSALDSPTAASSSTTRRPVIEVISITKEIPDEENAHESVAAAEEVGGEDYTDTSSSASTTVYAIGVIGIIPAAGLAAFLAKKFLRKTQKALPDSEERAEGFTPITHHSRKPSQTNTLDIEPSSVEAKNPKFSPWEFPRSKLRIVSVLGEGNFGVVWKAEARELCACEGSPGGPTVLVAVKGVKDGAGVKEKQDLLKELAIMQHIGQHPNIVTLLGCCTQQEPHYLVMEYVMFGKLLTFLRDHRTRHNYYNFSSDTEALTSKDLTRFACQIATGCDYLQMRGIIHRDLAARNILVDHNKVCKIADFGLARNVKDLGSDIYEQKSRGALPIRWMAPESLYMSIFTHKSDVWSLGILCWEIVTLGSTPYPGMTAREVMRRVREGYRLERPEHCRPEFYHIVTKCWHQDLNKRPSFTELKMEMSQLLEHGHHAYPCIDLENFPEANYFSMHDNDDEKL
ncbi:hypothetical protein SK128_003296 [Halocaridina rubra]|uniref:receptor protein-tyrosine kinase n=1 Tax=Halocaridina rubra TaxID=373956 RepID=A0AAN8XNS7_HALRR